MKSPRGVSIAHIYFHAKEIDELRFTTLPDASRNESPREFPKEDAGVSPLWVIFPTDLHVPSWDTSMRPISFNQALSRLRWHEVAGHEVTGEPEGENLPPRCRELVACSQTRFRDKFVHELAKTRKKREAKRKGEEEGRERERERDVGDLKESHTFRRRREDDGSRHGMLSLEWNPGMVHVKVNGYIFIDGNRSLFLCVFHYVALYGNWFLYVIYLAFLELRERYVFRAFL